MTPDSGQTLPRNQTSGALRLVIATLDLLDHDEAPTTTSSAGRPRPPCATGTDTDTAQFVIIGIFPMS